MKGLLDEPEQEQWPRGRHPSWQSEEIQEQNNPGQEVSHYRLGPQPQLAEMQGREKKSLENETLNKKKSVPLQLLSLPNLNSLLSHSTEGQCLGVWKA